MKQIFLYGNIDEETSKEVVKDMYELDEDFILNINSSGGDITDAFAIINAINDIKTRHNIYGLGNGKIYSSAVPIFVSCTKRFIMPNTSALLHSCSVSYNSNKLRDTLEDLDLIKKLDNELDKIIINKSKITKKQYEKEVTIKNRDWYLTDEEIITYGIAEKIIKKISEIK